MPVAEAQAALLPGIAGPFPGLRPFESDEETIFRGRRDQTDELLRRLASHRFLAVVGTSGSGKSSLVRAGLLPALDRGFLAGATSRWRIAVMRPGMAPIENLAEALRGSGPQQAVIEGADAVTLRSSSLGLVEAVRNAKLADGESLLVVADQFEELFRYSRRMSALHGGSEAAHFVNLLLAAARRPDAPVYVVLTMRSDFLGDCAQFPGLPEALSESQYLIPRLAREQRRQAIVEPLRLFGATMTPQLIEQLLNDSGDEPSYPAPADPAFGSRYRGGSPDPLPVLQHALLRTWLEWKALPQDKTGEPIDLPQYQNAGRMEAALNQHAERLFDEELDDEGRRWAERIFRCLTTTELGRPIRRPTPLADLYTIVGSKDEDRGKVDQVLDLFRRRDNSFLQLNKDGSVDIAHESLIWKWKRLRGWVADEAASAELYRDLVKDATGKATWGEPKLSSALAVRDKNAWNPDWARQYSEARFQDVQAFLARSRKAVRNQRWLRWFGVAAAVAVMILAVVAYYSMLRTRQREKELATVQIAQGSLAREQEALKEQLKGLNADKGATEADRDRIAKEKAAALEQLSKSQQDSQKLAAQAQQSSTALLANVKTLQSQLAAAQRERDDAVKARQDAEAKSDQLAKNLAAAQDAAAAAVKARQQSEAKSAPPPKAQERAPVPIPIPEPAHAVADKAAAAPTRNLNPMTNPKDGLVYVWIPPGSFTMGCSKGDRDCDYNEKPPHAEQIANGFWLSQTEVTQAAWKKVKGNYPSRFLGDRLPVEQVDWSQAKDYCSKIGGRLPTEKEWEYAARAGATGARYGELDSIAWYQDNSGGKTHPVRLRPANAFGLYDMLGNVMEWTDTNYNAVARVVRGGSWLGNATLARASYRTGEVPAAQYYGIGFRCVGEMR